MPSRSNACGVLERQLDAFLQALARLGDAADIVPAHRGRLDHHLAHRASAGRA